MNAIKLGDKVYDVVSGFKGIATARCRYLTGCDQILVVAKAKKKTTAEDCWFDENRLEVLQEVVVVIPQGDDAIQTQGLPG